MVSSSSFSTDKLPKAPPEERLIVALDVSSAADAQRIVTALGESVRFYKVGMQLYTAEGPTVVRELVHAGKQVFLDLKYHDIPNTVAAAVSEAAQLGVSMLTVHASGGTKMLQAAANAARAQAISGDIEHFPRVVAVTVLTSMDQESLDEVGVSAPVVDQVVRLASMALKAGCAGIVSSAQEVKTLREKLGGKFLAITPGVRPAGAEHGDQARVVTPTQAISAGASHIVVGRPITAAPNPAEAAAQIFQEIRSAKA
jgi:orotidine-5'-phosphate decarboxylase